MRLAMTILAAVLFTACRDNPPTAADSQTARFLDFPESELKPSNDLSVPAGYVVTPLARGSFPDPTTMLFKVKPGSKTTVSQVTDPSDVLTVRLTFQPGGTVGWHTHNGPVIVTVASGALTLIDGDDCVTRVYQSGQSFVDPGQGHVHLAYNATAGETVLYATFLDVPVGVPATLAATSSCPLSS